ncbi:hypothetical protein TELCIR_04415 [Teladorsagia circumcincta]|uniref:Uncharacterized protein n=1 Tax=Teladorsagia circumcincta TaxID=45464 RepID=A0A2G9UTY2_TELCI|nr:hypothetical protein TELCIR_04415 [Teladorsagia circumcincta]
MRNRMKQIVDSAWDGDYLCKIAPVSNKGVSGDETDPSWVGAWWIGFVLASLIAMLAVVPIICLPKVLPESLKWHRNRLVETSQAGRRRTPECCGLAGTNKTAALYRDAPLPGSFTQWRCK